MRQVVWAALALMLFAVGCGGRYLPSWPSGSSAPPTSKGHGGTGKPYTVMGQT